MPNKYYIKYYIKLYIKIIYILKKKIYYNIIKKDIYYIIRYLLLFIKIKNIKDKNQYDVIYVYSWSQKVI